MGAKTLKLFGVEQTPWQWASDPRCEVSSTTIRHRLAKGWPITRDILKLAAKEPRNLAESRVREQFEAFCYQHGSLGKFRTVKLAGAAILKKSNKGFILGLLRAKIWRVPLEVSGRGEFRQTQAQKQKAERVLAKAQTGKVFNGEDARQVIGTGKVDLLPSFDGTIRAICFDRRLQPDFPDRIFIDAGPLLEGKALRAARRHVVLPVFRKRRIKEAEGKWRGWEYVGHFKVKAFDCSRSARDSALESIRNADAANPRRGHGVDHKIWETQMAEMLELAEQGLQYKEIAERTGVPKTSVFRYLKNWQLERLSGRVPTKPKPRAENIAKTAAPRTIVGVLVLERVEKP